MRTRKCRMAGLFVSMLMSGAMMGTAGAAALTLSAGSVQGRAGGEVDVPVVVQGVRELGAFQMDLVYDASVLDPVGVTEGSALPAAMLDDNASAAGRWKVGVAINKPFSGDGELLRFKFKIRSGTRSDLTFERAHAWDHSNPPLEMLLQCRAGAVTVAATGRRYLYLGIGVFAVVGLLFAARAFRRA